MGRRRQGVGQERCRPRAGNSLGEILRPLGGGTVTENSAGEKFSKALLSMHDGEELAQLQRTKLGKLDCQRTVTSGELGGEIQQLCRSSSMGGGGGWRGEPGMPACLGSKEWILLSLNKACPPQPCNCCDLPQLCGLIHLQRRSHLDRDK